MQNSVSKSPNKVGRPQKEKLKKQYTLTMDENLHDRAQQKADMIGISFSAYVSIALDKYMGGE